MTTTTPTHRLLRRPAQDRMLAGVAAGIARYLGVDVTVVRVALIVLTVLGGGGAWAYIAGVLLIPGEGDEQSPAGGFVNKHQRVVRP
jgi:phage shock protein PspC (stress-responsive transcriptional regulator)